MANRDYRENRWRYYDDYDMDFDRDFERGGDFDRSDLDRNRYNRPVGGDWQDYSSGYNRQGRYGNQGSFGSQYGRGDYGRGEFSRGDYGRGFGEGNYGRSMGRGYGRESDFDWGDNERGYYQQSRYNQNMGRNVGQRRSFGRDYGPGRQGDFESDYGYGRGSGWQQGGYGQSMNRNYSRQGGYGQNMGRNYGQQNRYEYEDDFDTDFESPSSWTYSEVWFVPGPFTGMGPSGYQRSDDRIFEDVCERLSQHGQLDASEIEVDTINGEVILRGTVKSRLEKRMAEDIVEGVSGVQDVRNELRVQQQGQANQGQMQQGQQNRMQQSQGQSNNPQQGMSGQQQNKQNETSAKKQS